MFQQLRLTKLGNHWILSLIAGFLLIFCSLFAVNVKAIHLMQTDKIQESEKIIDTARRSVDHYLFTLKESASELMLNNQNMALQSAEDRKEFVSASSYRYSELMYNIKMANALVEDIYIYYPMQDYIVGTEGNYLSKSYFLLSNHLMEEGYSAWKDNVLESERTGFFFEESKEGKQKLYFRQRMPAGLERESVSVLIICVDGTEFARLLDMTLPHDGSTSVAVFNIENELYQEGIEEEAPSWEEILPLFKNIGNGMQKIEDQAYIGWRMLSDYGTFYYVVISDRATLLAHLTPIQHLLIAGILLCTAAGLALSVCLSFKHYMSVEKTINSLNEKVIWNLKENMLIDVLNQRLTDESSIKLLLQASGITLDYIYYRFLLADVSFEKNKNQIKEWILNSGKVLEQEYGSVDVIPAMIGGRAVFLLNYDASEYDPVCRLKEIFRNECKTSMTVKCSEEFMAPAQMALIYEQTVLIFQEQLGQVGDMALVQDKEGEILLERWRKTLLFREYANSAGMIPELMDKYVAASPDSYIRMSRQYTLVNETLRCTETEDERHHTGLSASYLDKMKGCAGVQEMSKCLQDILKSLEQLNSQYTTNQKDRLAYRIKKIIEENYNQHYLGLNYISEQVNVSTSYVSKVFKEEYGMGVVEYMNWLRIDHAKKIMKTQELTVKEIAEKVGFTSDIHFIRIFKKYENTTPGVYQKQSR
ncbi:MAG: AraC family transcriptional regulator [Lachnospiraceae bacterium]|nr:AraC family transcriptional regulator [Lachnospiraceae bacterium]